MINRFLEYVLMRSWWTIAYLLFCFILYERGIQKREGQFQQLHEQVRLLEIDKQQALARQQDLQLQINSQSDLSWIELTLMKGLGVIPEDYQKVYFFPDKN